MSIAIVGDVHITSNISSRVDDYMESILEKIREISYKAEHIIFLGDLFDKPNVPYSCYGKVWNELNYLSLFNHNKFYSILGNHDIYNEDENDLERTAIGLLAQQECIKLITVDNPVEIEGHKFFTTPVNTKSCKVFLQEHTFNSDDILLMHQYYEDEFESLCYDDVKNLGCKRIFFGHHHRPFEKLKKQVGDLCLYRCGSLSRNKAEEFQFTRDIYYFTIEHNNIFCNTVECVKPATEVFTQDALNHENTRKKEFVRGINDIISKYTNNISTENKFSIKGVLNEIQTPIYCMSYIESVYNKLSEKFE